MDGISTLFIRGEIVYKYVLLVIFVLEHYFVNTLLPSILYFRHNFGISNYLMFRPNDWPLWTFENKKLYLNYHIFLPYWFKSYIIYWFEEQ